MLSVTLISFLVCTGLVAFGTWFLTRRDQHSGTAGYFLAGRSLGAVFICGSLLLTNLSTEQLVGLNGAAFTDGLSVMAWEVFTVVSLVLMALFFLPKFLRSGIATIPQFLELRYNHTTQVICNFIFLIAYAVILLPIILYTGATGLAGIIDITGLFGLSDTAALWLMVWLVGIIGSVYAIFGGLRAVAISDTLNGVMLLTGGLMIVGFGLAAVGKGDGMLAGLHTITTAHPEQFNSIGGPKQSVPFSTLFTGVFLLCTFYWCTNQQIIQRTFGAKNLAEGQKGVLLTGALKLLGPLYLVLPGIIAFHLYAGQDGFKADHAYGTLVRDVLPAPLTGFFLAAMVGAVLSSFNSALNSTTTLFSLGIYKGIIRKDATEEQVVLSGKWFGFTIAIISMCVAPLLAGQGSIFGYLQKMNGMYFIPILAVIVVGMLFRRVPALAANVGLIAGVTLIALGYFVPSFDAYITEHIGGLHFLGIVFAIIVIAMLIIGAAKPRSEPWEQQYSGDVELTPWRFAKPAGIALLIMVAAIYICFAKF